MAWLPRTESTVGRPGIPGTSAALVRIVFTEVLKALRRDPSASVRARHAYWQFAPRLPTLAMVSGYDTVSDEDGHHLVEFANCGAALCAKHSISNLSDATFGSSPPNRVGKAQRKPRDDGVASTKDKLEGGSGALGSFVV